MIYQYDQALQLPTVDLYDTQMMAMALNAAKDMYEKNYQEMKDFKNEFGDFYSPISSDVDWVYNNTTKKVRDAVNDMYARGIDPLRSPQGRAMISQIINNVPVAEVNKRKQAAEAAKLYLKNMADLQSKGLWNPEMEKYAMGGKSLETWDTERDGMWTRTSPIQAKTMDDIIEPIVSKIDPSFDAALTAAKNDGYNYSTVSEDRIRQTIDDNMVDLISAGTAGGYYYKKAYDAAGGDPVKAKEILKDWYVNRASNHVKTLREADPYKLDNARTANDIKAHAANAATDYTYSILPYADTDGDGKLTKEERANYSKFVRAGGKDKNKTYNIFREAESRSGEDVAYGTDAALENYIAPMSNKISLVQDTKSKRWVYMVPGDEVQKRFYTEWTTSGANKDKPVSRYVGHGGEEFDKNSRYVFIPNGGLRHKRINGKDRYFIGGTLRKEGEKDFAYEGISPITYEMEVQENDHVYAKKKAE